jgi:hypothetical protein
VQALASVVQEAYVSGVPTRRVDQELESLGLRISKSEVSGISQGLDEQVDAFRNRRLEGGYPYMQLVVSDAIPPQACDRPGARLPWHRFSVHFLREALGHARPRAADAGRAPTPALRRRQLLSGARAWRAVPGGPQWRRPRP